MELTLIFPSEPDSESIPEAGWLFDLPLTAASALLLLRTEKKVRDQRECCSAVVICFVY